MLMNEPVHITITLSQPALSPFMPILTSGFRIRFQTGCSIEDLLCKQLELDAAYVNQRIQTIFLNGRTVDDIGTTMLGATSTLALSAAMPGLAGAALRTGGRYSAMRNAISHADHHEISVTESALLELRLFNLVAREIGPVILQRGILISARELSHAVESHPEVFGDQDSRICIGQEQTDVTGLRSFCMKDQAILFSLCVH